MFSSLFRTRLRLLPLFAALLLSPAIVRAAEPHTVVFEETGFPAADSAQPSEPALHAGFPGARFAGAAELEAALSTCRRGDLLVMPYGSSFPETAWRPILEYLDRGGNLLALGGKPFTRGAYRTSAGWQLRPPSVAASLELLIHDYQETPGLPSSRAEVHFLANADVLPALPSFAWKRAFSPVLRLSTVEMYKSDGSTGTQDADLTALAWGATTDSAGSVHKLAAPVLELDHLQHRFAAGRWILVACELEDSFFAKPALLAQLGSLALRRDDRFTLRPRLPSVYPRRAARAPTGDD